MELDVCNACNSVPSGLNANFIALVLEQKKPSKVGHFRPISMANFLMKENLSSFVDYLISNTAI